MKIFKNSLYVAIGFLIAALTISLTNVGAQVSEGIGRVFISNDFKNPVPITSKEILKVQGDVKIAGNPKVKLDADTKIKIESVEKPVRVRFEKTEAMPETGIFKNGKAYNISFDGRIMQRCEVEKINGTWIHCQSKMQEGETVGWINTAQLTFVSEFRKL